MELLLGHADGLHRLAQQGQRQHTCFGDPTCAGVLDSSATHEVHDGHLDQIVATDHVVNSVSLEITWLYILGTRELGVGFVDWIDALENGNYQTVTLVPGQFRLVEPTLGTSADHGQADGGRYREEFPQHPT